MLKSTRRRKPTRKRKTKLGDRASFTVGERAFIYIALAFLLYGRIN